MRHVPCLLSALVMSFATPALTNQTTDRAAVATHYADIAEASYSDSLTRAKFLQTAVEALISTPSAQTMDQARAAWIAARVPYMQTEVFRFGNPIVDDWEGGLNSWPLDEGLIDYVADSYFGGVENEQATLNVIATPKFTLSGIAVDASIITPDLLKNVLQEADQNEANVATGYHAIEFLLWGQDLVANAPQAGQRRFTDYASGAACTGGNCDRRAAYLRAATELLISDLDWMVAQWGAEGAARKSALERPEGGIAAMLTGIGNLSYGEMAGQRVKLGLILHDPEEEHDCFSDNTPASHHFDVLGMQNVYEGRYTRLDGTTMTGPSLREVVSETDPELANALSSQIAATLAATQALRQSQADGISYDMLLQVGNAQGESMIMAVVEALVTQARSVERVSAALAIDGVALEADDTLGPAGDVFQ